MIRSPSTPSCLALLTLVLGAAVMYASWRETSPSAFERHAMEYSSLVDALGAHDADSVDGLPQQRTPKTPLTLTEIARQAASLSAHIREAHLRTAEPRAALLARQLDAVALRADQLNGRLLSLSEELETLLGVGKTPLNGAHRPQHVLAQLERLLPGPGPLSRRLDAYQRQFIVPRGRLSQVVTRAVAACRAQTTRHLELPPGEAVDIEYVADRPWSGYSRYREGYRSTIQINRVFPHSVDEILTLACHEAYPGHHVYNVLRDRDLIRGRRWIEASVLPVFSPEGFRAEAIATAAAALTFSHEERLAVFRNELFPAVGLDPRTAERYIEVSAAVDALTGEIADVVIEYLQGRAGRDEAARALRERALMEHPASMLAFVDRYRAYTLAYTVGRAWLTADGSASPWPILSRLNHSRF